TTNNQQPTTNNQQPTTNNQQPTTNNPIKTSPSYQISAFFVPKYHSCWLPPLPIILKVQSGTTTTK
ncbi:hypothetical protein, partial [Balneatrix alpica]